MSQKPFLLMCLFAVLVAVLVACESELETEMPGYVTLTPLASAAVDDRSATPQEITGGGAETPSPTGVPCAPRDSEANTRYSIQATLNWAEHTVQVEEFVAYRNETGRTQDSVVFNVEANQEAGQFTLKQILTGGHYRIDDYRLEGVRLTVPLSEHLYENCEVGVTLKFTLVVPATQDGYSYGSAGYHLGYWGYSDQQLNLGMWLPLVAPFDLSSGWLTPRYTNIGEQGILPAADFDVQIEVEGAPENLAIAGPGTMTHPDPAAWRFVLQGARDITLSLSEFFHELTTITSTGVRVDLYYLAASDDESIDAPRHALNTAADSLALYDQLYGPYPYQRLAVVQGDFPDGMEFSGLVFVGNAWFKAWQGVPNDWLTLITAHEVAHQWWYALVGNDQGNDPYLDEALSIYSELLFLEHTYPEFVDWWWAWRVDAYEPEGYVDSTVYEFYSIRSYINAVYLRGAQMMKALRDDVGDQVFFAWLKDYADQMRGKVASPADFWGALPADVYAAMTATRQRYLRYPDVLAPTSVAEMP